MTGKIKSFPSSEFALLGFLFEGPCHGYELHKRLTEPDGVGMIWGVKLSNMYAQLEKLERKGLITGKLQLGNQHPSRMEFSLTEPGKDLFTQWLFQLVNHPRDFRHEFMVRMYFLLKYDAEKIGGAIRVQLAECERWTTAIKNKEIALSKRGTFPNMVYEFRLAQVQSMVDWLNYLLTQYPNENPHRGES